MKDFIAALACALFCFTAFADPAGDMQHRLFELRTYHAAPGKLADLEARFRNHTLKIFARHGMSSIGYWVPLDNTNNVLVYMLAFPNRSERDLDWKEFSADPEWQSVAKASEANGRLVTKVDSVFLTPTDFSPTVRASQSVAPRVFELRVYEATPGKFDALLARFRDHTTELFHKHKMTQFGYWTPTEKKDGAGEKLVYILAHESRDVAAANWKAFAADPEWVKAKAASEVNGPLTTNVQSVFMAPTDFSPTK
jgi:hypothetical protein